MVKAPFENYLTQIAFQRSAWARKPVLRKLYQHSFGLIVESLSPLKPTIEIGSGCGNFKAYFPESIATDLYVSGPWIDRVADAYNLPFSEGEVGNLTTFDVLHRLQRPLTFLKNASAALKPGGRLVLCEPAVTPWSRFVNKAPLDTDWKLFDLEGQALDLDPEHNFSNAGIPEILFWQQRDRTLAALPELKLVSIRKFGFILYPMTGDFGHRCFVPRFGFSAFLSIEDLIMRPFANWLTGVRMLVVLEKKVLVDGALIGPRIT